MNLLALVVGVAVVAGVGVDVAVAVDFTTCHHEVLNISYYSLFLVLSTKTMAAGSCKRKVLLMLLLYN